MTPLQSGMRVAAVEDQSHVQVGARVYPKHKKFMQALEVSIELIERVPAFWCSYDDLQ